MTVPDTGPRPATPPSDDVVLETIARLHSDAGELPGRDAVKTAAGIGSTRAARLIAQYAETQGIELPARGRKQARPVAAQPDRAGETGRADVAAQAGGHDDQGKQLQPTASAQSEQAGETGRDTTIAQADQAGGAGRTESTAQADRVGETGRVEAAAQASDAGETGRTGDTAQADNRAEDRADQAAPDASPVANRAAEAGETEPGEAAKWSAMLRGAVGGWLAADRSARDNRPAEPQSRPARIWRAVVKWAPGVVAFIAAFLATWAGGVTLATRLGWGPVEMFPGWIEWKFNPAFSLPLGMEVLVGVAVHRFLTVNTLAAKIGTGAIALLATVLAGVVQVFAHTPGPLPGWLGPMVGVLPVLSLVLVAVLGTIRPAR